MSVVVIHYTSGVVSRTYVSREALDRRDVLHLAARIMAALPHARRVQVFERRNQETPDVDTDNMNVVDGEVMV
ncbi:hypothetical protein [Frankia gtarii]|uniref:hypothetical protein n=1 Tax=Frankia gtarii TaxID=2950102 RepID=UPI0021BEA1A2|nr:hypothetical protein [Frankia gtarii]